MSRFAVIIVAVFLFMLPVWSRQAPAKRRAVVVAPKAPVATVSQTGEPLLGASGAILMDGRTGLVLWAKNADQSLPMASTTKIMTAVVILDNEKGRMNQMVTVSHNAADTGGSSWLAEGDKVTLDDLLKGALLCSSNEATVAAGEFVAGSEAKFVELMNAKAQELGLTKTHFINPHGLTNAKKDGGGHYSSARDLATMARYALQNYPLIKKYVASGSPRPLMVTCTPRGQIYTPNHNKLLGTSVPGFPDAIIDGVKTGFVNESGKCYVSSATRGDFQLISVVLNSPDMYREAQTLFTYGYTRYDWKTFGVVGQQVGDVPVKYGATRTAPVTVTTVLGAPVLKAEYGATAKDIVSVTAKKLTAPVARGEKAGICELRRDGVLIAAAPVISMGVTSLSTGVRALRALGLTLLSMLMLLLAGKIYGTCSKSARRRRRSFAPTGRNTDTGR